MKKLLLLLISLLLSFSSYAEWGKVSTSSNNNDFYIDLKTIKKIDGYVYSWELSDYSKPDENGTMSTILYIQYDCGISRSKLLTASIYKKPMGEELVDSYTDPNPQWEYIIPYSLGEWLMTISCILADASDSEKKNIINDILSFKNDEYLTSFKEDVEEELYLPVFYTENELAILQSTWIGNIEARVKSFWRYQGAEDDWECEVYVVQDRDGTVVAVDVRNCNVDDSGRAKAFKDSVRRAVYKASPLPSAPDESVFDRELMITFSVN